MISKKGFTLVEILCVITILALITTIATTSLVKLSRESKNNLYCAKIELIKSAAKTYAQNYEKELNNSEELYENHKSMTIMVEDLINKGLIAPDKNNDVLSPIDESSLNKKEIIIYLDNNQINVYIDTDNIC